MQNAAAAYLQAPALVMNIQRMELIKAADTELLCHGRQFFCFVFLLLRFQMLFVTSHYRGLGCSSHVPGGRRRLQRHLQMLACKLPENTDDNTNKPHVTNVIFFMEPNAPVSFLSTCITFKRLSERWSTSRLHTEFCSECLPGSNTKRSPIADGGWSSW